MSAKAVLRQGSPVSRVCVTHCRIVQLLQWTVCPHPPDSLACLHPMTSPASSPQISSLLPGQHLPGGGIGGDHPGVVLHDKDRGAELIEKFRHGLSDFPEHEGKALVADAVGDGIGFRRLCFELFFAVAADDTKHGPGILSDRGSVPQAVIP